MYDCCYWSLMEWVEVIKKGLSVTEFAFESLVVFNTWIYISVDSWMQIAYEWRRVIHECVPVVICSVLS